MKIRGFLTAMVVAIAGAALAACNDPKGGASSGATAKAAKSEADKGIELSKEELETAGVKVALLEPQTLVDRLVLTATIRANQDRIAHVAPRVPARIVRVNANLGQSVKKGQVLAVLDSIELGEAHFAYRQAQSQFALAKSDFERAQRLKNEDIIPEKDYLRARAEYEKARASLRAAEDKLRLLDVAHDASEQRAASVFPLNAPFAGTVIEKDAVLGELAQPDKSIFTVADLSTLWIEANLFEKDLARVRIGAPATVAVNAYPGEEFRGRLTYLSSTLDKETRTVQARIEVPNRDGRLKPQMFATAAVDTPSASEALALPRDAVPLVNGQPTAFVRENGRFEPRPVELGEAAGDRVVVKSGLKAGEEVVTRGAYALKARMLKSQIGDSH